MSIKVVESWNRHLENHFTLDGSLQKGVAIHSEDQPQLFTCFETSSEGKFVVTIAGDRNFRTTCDDMEKKYILAW